MKKLLIVLAFVPVLAAPLMMGCEAKVSEDGAKVKVDTNK